mmetsp:Transcript_1412/g.5588  ORF Transcript_1412/g.5588 Transcript_1412/m.5588 type:complete len:298 (+) Transcript_1412:920-1813(+)
MRVDGHVGHLQQHSADQMHRLQQLQVDVHVEGHLPTPLQLLTLRITLVEALQLHALGEQLLHTATDVQLAQARVRLADEAGVEGAKAELRNGAVEEDLRGHIHVLHALLHVRHEQQVARAVEVTRQRLRVDLTQHAARLGAFVAKLVDGGSELLRECRDGLGHGCLEHVDLEPLWLRQNNRRVRIGLVSPLGRLHGLLLRGRGLLPSLLRHLHVDAHGGRVHGISLVVYVLEHAHEHPGQRAAVLDRLAVGHRGLGERDVHKLIAQAVHVLHGVRVDALEGLEELVVEALEERHEVA